jgi:hypothetical protein
LRLTRRGAGCGWPGGVRRRCGASSPPGGQSPAVPACQPHANGPCRRRNRWTGRPSAPFARGPHRWIGASSKPECLKGQVHRGRRGGDARTSARGTPWVVADLRFNGLQHASMLRGVGVRGSVRAQASRAPSGFPGEAGRPVVLDKRRRRMNATRASPGPTPRTGPMTRGCIFPRSFRGASASERTRNPYAAAKQIDVGRKRTSSVLPVLRRMDSGSDAFRVVPE